MQNDRRDGMGFAVTTPSALEEFEQIEVVDGLGGPMYGPANPSGMFNFVTKRPTEQPLREVELNYEGNTVGTVHVDLSGHISREEDIRLPHESRIGGWDGVCNREPTSPPTSGIGCRRTSRRTYSDRRQSQLL